MIKYVLLNTFQVYLHFEKESYKWPSEKIDQHLPHRNRGEKEAIGIRRFTNGELEETLNFESTVIVTPLAHKFGMVIKAKMFTLRVGDTNDGVNTR